MSSSKIPQCITCKPLGKKSGTPISTGIGWVISKREMDWWNWTAAGSAQPPGMATSHCSELMSGGPSGSVFPGI